jgi:Cdc6-like AAA superfamily ATPase
MSSQKLFFLLAIIKGLKKRFDSNISFVDILRGYQMICENYALHPRSNSQLWNYLQEFKRESIIMIEILGEKIRGRRALIQIPEIDLLKLEKIVVEILQSKGLSV